jgi:hypothetical protein
MSAPWEYLNDEGDDEDSDDPVMRRQKRKAKELEARLKQLELLAQARGYELSLRDDDDDSPDTGMLRLVT